MDLKNRKLIYLKAIRFVFIGCGYFGLVLMEVPSATVAVYLLLMIWAFCRANYFAFYVIGKYVDPSYKFSGLISFSQCLAGRKD